MYKNKKEVETWFRYLRDLICNEFEKFEKKTKFKKKKWRRKKLSSGGGEISILRDGKVFEKVGVNISTVFGSFDRKFSKQIPGTSTSRKFWASGISVVIHPKNPNIPSLHFNTRYIETGKKWFGGGIDMTPNVKNFKINCDKYFYLPHRNEPRGDGGIFFDYLDKDLNKNFSFIKDVGLTFLIIARQLIKKNLKKQWNKKLKNLQLIKRAKYAEFNLLYDRGTKFGLNTDGNVEAIFMSLPPSLKW
jgi:coproporphyrinogen III oxidase